MNLLSSLPDSIAQLFFRKKVNPLPDIFAGRGESRGRRHHRHELNGIPFGYIELPNGTNAMILDFSYGGVAIKAPDQLLGAFADRERKALAKLLIVDEVYLVSVAIKGARKGITGCEFIDLDASQTQFVESVISFMDAGVLMAPIPLEGRPENFRDPSWHCFSNPNGSIHCYLSVDDSHALQEMNMVYTLDGVKYYVYVRGNQIKIASSKKKPLTLDQKRMVLRNAVYIITGARQFNKMLGFDHFVHLGLSLLRGGP